MSGRKEKSIINISSQRSEIEKKSKEVYRALISLSPDEILSEYNTRGHLLTDIDRYILKSYFEKTYNIVLFL